MGTHITSPAFVEPGSHALPLNREAHSSGVSWGAVIGGAFVTSALSLILLALGAGFGLSVVSPWSGAGIAAPAADTLTIVWLIAIEIIASGFGGYLTGRLRTKWTSTHGDEVFFRDTANGFLAWAVALVASVAFLASAAVTMAGREAQTRAPGNGFAEAAIADPNMYFVDVLFRSDRASGDSGDIAVKAEADRILRNGLVHNQMSAADQDYLSRLISARTGLTPDQASKRVADVVNQARQNEDEVRKATAHILLWSFLALLTGAFSASCAATVGGRQRDHVRTI